MFFLYAGLTLGTLGKLILGMAVIRVHTRIFQEHKIDNVVLHAIEREKYFTAFGIFLIIVGFILEIAFYSNTSFIGS